MIVIEWWLPPLIAALAFLRYLLLARISFSERQEDALAKIDGRPSAELVPLVAGLLRNGGANTEIIPPDGNHGLDVLATAPTGAQIAVGCFRHTGRSTVTQPELEQFHRHILNRYRASPTTVMIVTSGRITDPARNYAKKHEPTIVIVERHELGLWVLGRSPSIRGLRPHRAQTRSRPLLSTRDGARVVWLTPIPALVALITAGAGRGLLLLAAGLATAAAFSGIDAHFINPDPPPQRWSWWPRWAQASAALALAAFLLALLALHVLFS